MVVERTALPPSLAYLRCFHDGFVAEGKEKRGWAEIRNFLMEEVGSILWLVGAEGEG